MNSKKLLALLLALVMTLSCLVSCDAVDQINKLLHGDDPKPETELDNDGNEENKNDDTPTYTTITIAEALELCGESGNVTTERYYIRATVKSIDNANFGVMTICDETGEIGVYRTDNADGTVNYSAMTDRPYAGDEVLLYCTLQNYNGTREIKSAYLIEFKKAEHNFDETDYTAMSIADARDAAKGTLVKVDGVVAKITYANGRIPSGVILVDETQSIYVYDSELAARVAIGNKIEILATKTYWILDTEQNSAAKFGYIGCNQLENAKLISNDNGSHDFDKSWITESTVKEIMDNPVNVDITTTIFKVNALVNKVDGAGFVNYYINDLDGKTGSYVYTQCNGSDFSYLDQFDGKICTVYLMPLNAKSTSSDCFYRFLPILVEDNGFVFDTTKAAEHAVKYYGVTTIASNYTGDPAIELVTSVSSTLLGFENATLSYSSDNESVVYFTTADGKTVLHCGRTGTANVTIKGAYNGVEYSETITISVTANEEYPSITIAEAIGKEVGEIVTIRGIVGPSVVNKSGFYLFDETGMVAVTVDASVFATIEIGHEVVLQGKRDCFKDAAKTHAGQIAISNCTVLANYYGEHDYPTNNFITGKTLLDLYNLNVNEDHSTEVYIVKATIVFNETAYYTNLQLTADGVSKYTLYCSGAGQYSFLKDYAGQEVTLEIAPCNWNNKTYYAGCVLAVYTADGKVLNELNFNNN